MSQDTRAAAVAEAIAQADASLCNAGLTTYTELRAALDDLLCVFDEEAADGVARDDARIDAAREALAKGIPA